MLLAFSLSIPAVVIIIPLVLLAYCLPNILSHRRKMAAIRAAKKMAPALPASDEIPPELVEAWREVQNITEN